MASITSHCFFVLLLFSLAFSLLFNAEAHQSVPFYSIYSFGDDDSTFNVADHLATVLGLPSPPQPYTNEGAEFELGINFMMAGATIMKPFFFVKNGMSPPQQSHHSQINTFMNLFYKDCFTFHDCGRNKVLSNAIIVMDQPGFNDYKHGFLHGKSTLEVSKLVTDVVETIKNNIETLINDAGAKHFLVSGILPIGCLPGFGKLVPESNNYKCHKGVNLFARLHNDHLWQALQELRLKYPEVDIKYADYFKAFMALLRCPFNFELTKLCGGGGVEACSDQGWDRFRLPPDASKNLIDTLFSKKGFISPEFKFTEDQAERQHPKIYSLFRDGLRHLFKLRSN